MMIGAGFCVFLFCCYRLFLGNVHSDGVGTFEAVFELILKVLRGKPT